MNLERSAQPPMTWGQFLKGWLLIGLLMFGLAIPALGTFVGIVCGILLLTGVIPFPTTWEFWILVPILLWVTRALEKGRQAREELATYKRLTGTPLPAESPEPAPQGQS